MKLKNCPTCGKPVRLRATKIWIDRKPGVAHYIAHKDGSPMHDKGWDCAAMKPYPVREEDKPWAQLCARWNDAGGATTMATKAEKNFEKALLELAGEDVSTALSVLTGCFVSLTLEVLRRKGHVPDGDIKIDGGKQRDITIHKSKIKETE